MSEWIKWEGGECPVEKIAVVNVRLRDKAIRSDDDCSFASQLRWIHTGSGADILEYRLESGSKPEYTGASVSYYKLHIASPVSGQDAYMAECQDIIENLGMDFNEANAFKALWRRAAARTLGKTKKGYDGGLYDAEKVLYAAQRLVALAKAANP